MTARRRIFFACWPDAATAARLHALSGAAHAACGGRRMRRDTLHLTLAFIGDVDDAGFDLACAAGDAVEENLGAGDTVLTLDRLACWRHNRIAWAGCAAVPETVANLAGALAAELRGRGFALDARPFAAHVTLLRDADCGGALPAVAPCAWPVREFVLAQSRRDAAGARYDIVRRWPLAGQSR